MTHYAIYIGDGNGHTITGNNIGGSVVNCGGSAWTVNGNYANKFVGIYLNVGTATASEVQNNTIQNFSWTHYGTTNITSLPGAWCGIYLNAGNANIGKYNR